VLFRAVKQAMHSFAHLVSTAALPGVSTCSKKYMTRVRALEGACRSNLSQAVPSTLLNPGHSIVQLETFARRRQDSRTVWASRRLSASSPFLDKSSHSVAQKNMAAAQQHRRIAWGRSFLRDGIVKPRVVGKAQGQVDLGGSLHRCRHGHSGRYSENTRRTQRVQER